jgi:SAM-dependent methyltransferase
LRKITRIDDVSDNLVDRRRAVKVGGAWQGCKRRRDLATGGAVLDLKRRLKPWLLPLWNGGHRLAWRAGEYVDAIRRRQFERCDACGRSGPILYRRRVIPPKLEELWGLSPRLAEALARKESCECAWCGAKLRGRRLARVLLESYPVGEPPGPARSVAAWARSPEARTLRIAEFNRIDGLHEQLQSLPNFAYSEFQEGVTPGAVVDGVRAEDLTRLTYPDASFDLVLTSETLEHVPDLAAALVELRRVLRPGGLHLFTVPRLPGITTTFARAVVDADGRVEHRAPAIRHPGGDVGYPVFTEFGADLPEVLRRAGFETTVHFGPTTEDDLAQVYASRKVGE